MKNINYVFIFFWINCISYSCTPDKPTEAINIIEQKKLTKVDVVKFGDKTYFEDCFLIALETTEESLIADITQMEIIDEQIYIYDHQLSKIMVFNLDGKYLHAIGIKGSGPEEYLSVSGFYIDNKEKTINLFDPLNMAVVKYRTSGEFLTKTTHLNKNISFVKKAIPIGENELFCYSGSNWEDNSIYSIINKNDYSTITNIRHYPISSDEHVSYSYSKQPFSFFNDEIVFGMLFSDTILRYKESLVTPSLFIKNKQNIPLRLLEVKLKEVDYNYSSLLNELANDKAYSTGLMNVFENGRFVICDFKSEKYSVNAILWDKKEKKGIYIDNYLHHTPNFGYMAYAKNDVIIKVWNSNAISVFKNEIANNNTSLKTLCRNLGKVTKLPNFRFIFVKFGIYGEHFNK